MVCACEGVPISMHNARLAIDHHVFSTWMGMPESISSSCSESGRTIPNEDVQFWPFGDELVCARQSKHCGFLQAE